MAKKNSVPKKDKSPECCKCKAWDISEAAKLDLTHPKGKIVGTCIRNSPQVIITYTEDGASILSACWPVTDEDKGCYDIIWKEGYQ